MRKFRLDRVIDSTGVSGTGVIAEGIVFSDGTVAMRWLTRWRSTGFYSSMEDLLEIHTHGGDTVVLWDAEAP